MSPPSLPVVVSRTEQKANEWEVWFACPKGCKLYAKTGFKEESAIRRCHQQTCTNGKPNYLPCVSPGHVSKGGVPFTSRGFINHIKGIGGKGSGKGKGKAKVELHTGFVDLVEYLDDPSRPKEEGTLAVRGETGRACARARFEEGNNVFPVCVFSRRTRVETTRQSPGRRQPGRPGERGDCFCSHHPSRLAVE